MKQYYLKNGTRESGPYILDDLKYQRISSSSLIKVDNGNWEPISHHKELRFLLATSEGKSGSGSSVVANPTRSQTVGATDADKAKAKSVVLIAIVMVIAVMGFAMFFFVNSASK